MKKHWYKVRSPSMSLERTLYSRTQALNSVKDMHYADFAEDEVNAISKRSAASLTVLPRAQHYFRRSKNMKPANGRSLARKLASLQRYDSRAILGGEKANTSRLVSNMRKNILEAKYRIQPPHARTLSIRSRYSVNPVMCSEVAVWTRSITQTH